MQVYEMLTPLVLTCIVCGYLAINFTINIVELSSMLITWSKQDTTDLQFNK